LWGEEKLDEFFPRQELVDEMHKLHEEHREAKRKAREDIDMGDAGETGEEEKEFSEEEAIWARKLDGAAIDKEKKIDPNLLHHTPPSLPPQSNCVPILTGEGVDLKTPQDFILLPHHSPLLIYIFSNYISQPSCDPAFN
jgi:hypothetical protein